MKFKASLLVLFLHTVGAHLTQDTWISAVPQFPNFLRKTHIEEQGLLCAWVAESSDAGLELDIVSSNPRSATCIAV